MIMISLEQLKPDIEKYRMMARDGVVINVTWEDKVFITINDPSPVGECSLEDIAGLA